ncbi:MAG: VRR-NUC domain-containing protein [Lentisphaeria bacterium]
MHLIQIALSDHGVTLRLNVGEFTTKDGRHISSGLPKGTSDLLFIGHGYIAFIEVKTEKGRIRPEQIKFINTMRKLGHRAGVARSIEDALKIIQEDI